MKQSGGVLRTLTVFLCWLLLLFPCQGQTTITIDLTEAARCYTSGKFDCTISILSKLEDLQSVEPARQQEAYHWLARSYAAKEEL